MAFIESEKTFFLEWTICGVKMRGSPSFVWYKIIEDITRDTENMSCYHFYTVYDSGKWKSCSWRCNISQRKYVEAVKVRLDRLHEVQENSRNNICQPWNYSSRLLFINLIIFNYPCFCSGNVCFWKNYNGKRRYWTFRISVF